MQSQWNFGGLFGDVKLEFSISKMLIANLREANFKIFGLLYLQFIGDKLWSTGKRYSVSISSIKGVEY